MSKYVSHFDNFVIVNTTTFEVLEGHYDSPRANHFCEVVNNHEIRNGRPACYWVEKIIKEATK